MTSIDEALDLIEREPQIDVVLLDTNLGGEATYPAADRLMETRVSFIFAPTTTTVWNLLGTSIQQYNSMASMT